MRSIDLSLKKLQWSTICPSGEAIHLASVKAAPGVGAGLHVHDFFECFLVESGRGKHLFPDHEDTLFPRDLHFVRPEQAHGLKGSTTEPLLFINAAFEAGAAQRAVEWCPGLGEAWKADSRPVSIQLNASQRQRFVSLVEAGAASPREPMDAMLFLLGLGRLLRPVVEGTVDADLPDWMREALPKASEPANLQHGAPRLIELCGRSHEHVTRSFQKHLGMTPTRWLTGERIRFAGRLLETTRMSVLEIAFECGFQSLSHFHSRFRSANGRTPLQYRNRAVGVQSASPSSIPRV